MKIFDKYYLQNLQRGWGQNRVRTINGREVNNYNSENPIFGGAENWVHIWLKPIRFVLCFVPIPFTNDTVSAGTMSVLYRFSDTLRARVRFQVQKSKFSFYSHFSLVYYIFIQKL